MKLHICQPHGYCEGVMRAITIALNKRKEHPNTPIAILGMLVHNEFVIELLEKHNIMTINRPTIDGDNSYLGNLPKDTLIIFTAHGHPLYYEDLITSFGLTYIDATCPKVEITHDIINEALNNNQDIIYIGQSNHPETEAALSIDDKRIFLYDLNDKLDFSRVKHQTPKVVNQTTLAINELEHVHNHILENIPGAEIHDEICRATRMRQEAVKNIPADVDLIYIVGSTHSNNTKKLVDVARISHSHADVYHIQSVADITPHQYENKKSAAVAAGASTPLHVTREVINHLKQLPE